MTFKLLLRTLRAPFFTATTSAALLGNLVALWQTGGLNPWMLVLSLVGIAALNAGVNTANDYFDSLSGNDEANRYFSPFNGGSRVIQDGLVSRRTVGLISAVCFVISAGIGAVIWLLTPGNWILYLGLFGLVTGAFYAAPPLKLGYRGLGEIIVALDVAFLPVLGGYYVQAGSFHLSALYAGIAAAFLILGVIWINQIPDIEADAAAGKRTLVVRLGARRSRTVFGIIVAAVYVSSVILVLLGLLPYWTLLILLTLPLAVGAVRGAWSNYDEPGALVPAEGRTVQLQLFGNLALSLGFALAALVPL
jgi:1,4-dihydroxy-2-naphthoate octaprenyltransferase